MTRSFPKIPEEVRSLPKKSKVFRRCPKSSEDVQSLPKAKLSRKRLSTKSEIARKVLSFIHFTHGFRSLHGSELTYFWKLCQARWQQLTFFNQAWGIGPQAWARGEIEVNPLAWDSRLRCESWQVYFVWTKLSSEALYWCHGVRQVQSTPLSISSTQHIWELSWLGTAQQFSHDMRAGEGGSGVTIPWSVCQ